MENSRKLNEEGFKRVFRLLKIKTKNFTKFYPELITENNQYLLIIRVCLGLSQKAFANKLGTTKDWCRHIESSRNRIIHLGVAKRYHKNIERLLNTKQISLENSLESWKKYKFSNYQEFSPTKIKMPQISKLSESDLKKYFKWITIKTKSFKNLNSSIISEAPQSILLFRIILGLNHRKFARLVKLNARTIRNYESSKTGIKPQTAEFVIKVIKKLLEENKNKRDFNKVLENYRILTGFFGHRNLDSMASGGLYRLAGLNRNVFENEIMKMLKKNKIPFEKFSIIEGAKKRYNVDFSVPNSNKPQVAIESFEYTIGGKSKNFKSKVINIDHRFQAIKLRYPRIKTITVIRLKGKPILMDFIKRSLEIETLNTDHLVINDEIKELPMILSNYKVL